MSNFVYIFLHIASKNNLKLNKDKCKFGVQQLVFWGDIIGVEVMKPDRNNVFAIVT